MGVMLAEHYKNTGHVVIKGVLSGDELYKIEKHVDRIYQPWMQANKAEILNRKLVNMHSLTNPQYFEGLHSERVNFFNAICPLGLVDIAESIFGPGLYFHNTQLFFNPLNTERRPYWHRDMQYSPLKDSLQKEEQRNILSLHIRIPLVEEKGLELIPGTHLRWDTTLEQNVRFELNGHKNSEALPDSEVIHLTPGDIVIFNAQMIHRGNYVLSRERKAFDICIGKYHPATSNFLDGSVLPSEEELSYIEYGQWYELAREIAI